MRRAERDASGVTAEYRIWLAMLRRCRDPKYVNYDRYGGRGIFVCGRWLSYESFLSDMGRRPSPQHSIGRKNNDGPYSPENCGWETAKEQSRNKRPARLLYRRIYKQTANSKLSVRCSEELRKEVKIAALDTGDTLEELAMKAINFYLREIGQLSGAKDLT